MLAIKPIASWARAAKHVRADGTVEPYRLGRSFVGAECGWTTAREAFDTLERLRHEPLVCLIRGTLAPGAPHEFPRRYRGDDRAVLPCARRLLGVDFDDIGPAQSVEDAARIALQRLPAGLRAGPVRVQLTTQATRQNARCRVWLWLARPAGDRSVRTALRGLSDTSLYNPVQPHYTADATREAPDPWDVRVWESDLGGEAAIDSTDDLAAQSAEQLQIHDRRIRRTKEGARHPAVNAAAYELGRYVGAGLADRTAVRDALVAAAMHVKLTHERACDEIDRAMQDGERKPITEDAWRARLARDPNSGAVRTSETNALAVLTNDPGWADRLALDVTTRAVVWIDPPPWAKPGAVDPAEHVLIAQQIERDHRMTFSARTIETAVATAAHLAPIDPVREWLEDQPWDGVPRVDRLLIDLLGADDTAYTRDASRALALGLADRILNPGCQQDLSVVLVGEQGCGKTSFLRDLGGPWYAELADLSSDDAVYVLERAALIELGELAALSRADLERTKAFVSRTIDVFRRKYGRDATRVPRRCVFAGTTNHDRFLIDPTGDRRWLPVRVTRYDRAHGAEVLAFVLGEARERVRMGERYHVVADAENAQAAHRTVDPWIAELAMHVGARPTLTLREAAAIVGLAADRATQQTSRRLALAVRAMGWRETSDGWARP